MKCGKKGIFYSVMALLFITPIIMLTLSSLNFYQSGAETKTSKIVGEKLVAYTKSIGEDLPKALSIMANHVVSDAIVYLETNGTAYNDSGAVLAEIISNGTIYGKGSSSDFTVNSWAQIMKQKGQLYGFTTDVRVMEVRFSSPDPYNLGVHISILVNVTAPSENMEFYRIYNHTEIISIEGFDDPLYTLKTNGVLKREIRSPNATVSSPANFDRAVAYGWYMPSDQGPNFLDRLEGRTIGSGKYNSSTAAGLESVAYIPDLQANGLMVKQGQTDIDYLYFDSSSNPGLPVNQSSYGWLRIDGTHAAAYNLTLG